VYKLQRIWSSEILSKTLAEQQLTVGISEVVEIEARGERIWGLLAEFELRKRR